MALGAPFHDLILFRQLFQPLRSGAHFEGGETISGASRRGVMGVGLRRCAAYPTYENPSKPMKILAIFQPPVNAS
jgi:hypothetical protein